MKRNVIYNRNRTRKTHMFVKKFVKMNEEMNEKMNEKTNEKTNEMRMRR